MHSLVLVVGDSPERQLEPFSDHFEVERYKSYLDEKNVQQMAEHYSMAASDVSGLSEKIQAQQTIVGDAIIQTWNQDLARLQREAQFARQEAQIQSEALQQQVLADFSKKIQPVIEAVRVEKGLYAIVGVQNEPGGLTLLSAEPGMDLSAEIVRRLNATK